MKESKDWPPIWDRTKNKDCKEILFISKEEYYSNMFKYVFVGVDDPKGDTVMVVNK